MTIQRQVTMSPEDYDSMQEKLKELEALREYKMQADRALLRLAKAQSKYQEVMNGRTEKDSGERKQDDCHTVSGASEFPAISRPGEGAGPAKATGDDAIP